jgi:hypothetical protein
MDRRPLDVGRSAGAHAIERQEGEDGGEGVAGSLRREEGIEEEKGADRSIAALVEVAGDQQRHRRQGGEASAAALDLQLVVMAQQAEMEGADMQVRAFAQAQVDDEYAARLAAGRADGAHPCGLGIADEARYFRANRLGVRRSLPEGAA